jgi:bifunctional DNA-binding transcriptional regulator/antitoxin component of YhaV-PrlF toxin-antitoxin module
MSATAIGDKRQTTMPQEVLEAAGLRVGDQVDWRYEAGEIRGRPLIPAELPVVTGRLVKRAGGLAFELPAGFTVSPEAIADAVDEERRSR